MRRALLGGIAAILLGAASAYLVPTSISRVPCRETTDLERLHCVPERSKRLEVHIWADPDILLPPRALEAGIRLATEMMDEQGIPLYTHIVKESLAAQYGSGSRLPDGVVGVDILRENHYVAELKRYGKYDEKEESVNPTAGYALLPERLSLAAVRDTDMEEYKWCPGMLPLRIATLLLHEIGHLEGLIHPDLLLIAGTACSDIKLHTKPEIIWNIMKHDILGYTWARWLNACHIEPERLTAENLGIGFDPVQGLQMRDAISGGAVWQTMTEKKFEYQAYVRDYESRIEAREYVATAHNRSESCSTR